MSDLESWLNFYLAGAGAAAALTGLFIVAISVNLDAILAERSLTARTAGTLSTLVLALIVCMAGLMRDQSLRWFAAEIFVFAAFAWIVKVRAAIAIRRSTADLSPAILVGEALSGQGQTLPFFVGAALLFAERSGALIWIGFGVLAVFALSMVSTWVLLIEIRR